VRVQVLKQAENSCFKNQQEKLSQSTTFYRIFPNNFAAKLGAVLPGTTTTAAAPVNLDYCKSAV